MTAWQQNLLEEDDDVAALLRSVRTVAVLGIKPESQSGQPAFYVPQAIQARGWKIIPVPVYFPDVTKILGEPVHRTLAAIPGELDLVDVFRRPSDIPAHLPDILARKPRAVWFQSGIRHDGAAAELARAGILVVQDRCLMVEQRRLL